VARVRGCAAKALWPRRHVLAGGRSGSFVFASPLCTAGVQHPRCGFFGIVKAPCGHGRRFFAYTQRLAALAAALSCDIAAFSSCWFSPALCAPYAASTPSPPPSCRTCGGISSVLLRYIGVLRSAACALPHCGSARTTCFSPQAGEQLRRHFLFGCADGADGLLRGARPLSSARQRALFGGATDTVVAFVPRVTGLSAAGMCLLRASRTIDLYRAVSAHLAIASLYPAGLLR